jgi:hypothetical protein
LNAASKVETPVGELLKPFDYATRLDMKMLLTLCLITLVGLRCQSPNARPLVDQDSTHVLADTTAPKKPSEQAGTPAICTMDTSTLRVGQGEIIVISDILMDSIGKGERHWVFPINKSQHVSILFKGREVYSENHDLETLRIQTANSGIQDVLGNWIVVTSIYSTSKGLLFQLNGWGGCDWCTEFTQLIDTTGSVVYVHHHAKRREITRFGNLESILKAYEIDDEEYSHRGPHKAPVPSEGFKL